MVCDGAMKTRSGRQCREGRWYPVTLPGLFLILCVALSLACGSVGAYRRISDLQVEAAAGEPSERVANAEVFEAPMPKRLKPAKPYELDLFEVARELRVNAGLMVQAAPKHGKLETGTLKPEPVETEGAMLFGIGGVDREHEDVAEDQNQQVPWAIVWAEGRDRFRWPLPIPGLITSPFGLRFHPTQRKLMVHEGIDVATEPGVAVLAAGRGIVCRTGFDRRGKGRFIHIDHGKGWETRYYHLRRIYVRRGERIDRRQAIGTVGSSGRSTGPHLHFEVRYHDQVVDPMSFF